MRCEGNHAPLKGVAANPWLWLLRGDDNGLKMNRFHEELGANPRRSWLNSRNGKISKYPASCTPARQTSGRYATMTNLYRHRKRVRLGLSIWLCGVGGLSSHRVS